MRESNHFYPLHASLHALLVVFAMLSPVVHSVAITPSLASCDSLKSCSPQSCQTDADGDCSFPSRSTPNFVSSVASATCRVCSQATSSRVCANMASTLSKSGGIKAAYCTDQFLVVWSTGKPSYNPSATGDYLRTIPRPPGGDQVAI